MKRLTVFLICFAVLAFGLDVVFQDVDIKDALSQLAAMSDTIILFSPNISGRVTLEIYDVSLETALNLLLSQTGYDWAKKDGYYLVADVTDRELLVLGVPRLIELKHTSVEQLMPFLRNYQRYIAGFSDRHIVVFSGEKVFKQISEIVEKLDVPVSSKLVWYRYVRFSDEEGAIFNQLKSSSVFSFNEKEFTIVTDQQRLIIDDVVRLIQKKSEERISSGICVLTEGRETKIEITRDDRKFQLSLLSSAGQVKVSLNDGKTNVETSFAEFKGKSFAAIFDGGILELRFGEVVPVVFKEKPDEFVLNHEVLVELLSSESTEILVGVGTNLVGNLRLALVGGLSEEKMKFGIKLNDKRDLAKFLTSYGDLVLLLDKDFNFSTRFSIGLGFSFKSVTLGGGLWTDFQNYYPEARLLLNGDRFALRVSYVFVQELKGFWVVGFSVRW